MPGTEANHETEVGLGRLSENQAISAAETGSRDEGREPAAASASAAGASTAAGAPTDPGDDHARADIPPDQAVHSEQALAERIVSDGRASEIEFNIAVDIIYDRARASWLTLCHRIFLFGAIVAGSTAASDLASAKFCAFAAAGCAALDLVFDPSTGAASYREFVRAAHDVLVRLKQHRFSSDAIEEAEIALLKISGTETAPYNAVRELAFNQARLAFGRDDLEEIHVGVWRRAFAQVWRFEGD